MLTDVFGNPIGPKLHRKIKPKPLDKYQLRRQFLRQFMYIEQLYLKLKPIAQAEADIDFTETEKGVKDRAK